MRYSREVNTHNMLNALKASEHITSDLITYFSGWFRETSDYLTGLRNLNRFCHTQYQSDLPIAADSVVLVRDRLRKFRRFICGIKDKPFVRGTRVEAELQDFITRIDRALDMVKRRPKWIKYPPLEVDDDVLQYKVENYLKDAA